MEPEPDQEAALWSLSTEQLFVLLSQDSLVAEAVLFHRLPVERHGEVYRRCYHSVKGCVIGSHAHTEHCFPRE